MHKRVFWIVLGVLALLALTTTVAWAAPALQEEEDLTTDALWIALAPLLAIATSIERVMEAIWDRWERFSSAKEEEKKKLRSWLKGWLPDPEAEDYGTRKKLWSHWLGTLFAFVAIAFTNVRLFRLLDLDVDLLFSSGQVLFNFGVGGIFDNFTWSTLIDWLVTAFIIGWGGTELTHSILTGLVKGRGLWKEMQEVQKGEKSVLDVRLFKSFQEEIAPELEKLGISVASLRQALTALDKAGVSVDQFIADMTRGKAEGFLRGLEGETGKAVLDLLEGTPEAKGPDPIQLGKVLDKVAPELRQKFLGA